MLLHVVSAAAPVAATAGQWVWDKSNSAVNRVSLYCFFFSFFFLSSVLKNNPESTTEANIVLRLYLFSYELPGLIKYPIFP